MCSGAAHNWRPSPWSQSLCDITPTLCLHNHVVRRDFQEEKMRQSPRAACTEYTVETADKTQSQMGSCSLENSTEYHQLITKNSSPK